MIRSYKNDSQCQSSIYRKQYKNSNTLLLIFIFNVITLLIISNTASATIAHFCWKNSYTRGAGTPISGCPNDTEKNGALCYPNCKSGYKGVGPVCWQKCPNGFKDDGVYCRKPKGYGRGKGYSDKKQCQREKGECEKNGLLFYPNCKPGYKAVGCCMCSPKCSDGQKDIGVSCEKKSYGRSAGKPMQCAEGLEKDGALCYPKCKSKFSGVGPVCWADKPKKSWVDCAMGAATSSGECFSRVRDQVLSVGQVAAFVASLGTSSGATSAAKVGESAQKFTKLRAQFAKLQKLYKANQTLITNLQKAKKLEGQVALSIRIGNELSAMNSQTATPEDIVRISAEAASMLDPSGISSTVAAYTYPTCDKVQ